MTGEEAVALIHQRSWVGCKPGLDRTRELLSRLGNPQDELKFVHITGTNGKGSTASIVASVLRAAGYRTGLFTSPHLYRFNERMQVDDTFITDGQLVALTQRVLAAAEGMAEQPTEFELMTAIGLCYFQQERCDIAVLEVGLGGRLDSTNVIPVPEAAVITNIGLEHTQQLGNTHALIAAEKAGIIKENGRAVLYGQREDVEDVVRGVCAEKGASLTITDETALEVLSSTPEGQTFRYRGRGPYRLALLGAYQLKNAITALDTIETLRARGWVISEAAIAQGLAQARWPGRLELARRTPDFIIDGGHNPQCAQALTEALRGLYGEKKLIFLVGVLADKDWHTMLSLALPMAKAFVTMTPPSYRALDAQVLSDWLHEQGAQAEAAESVADGVARALALASEDDVICAWGSLYSTGEVRHCLGLC